jgi:hypothetical protein
MARSGRTGLLSARLSSAVTTVQPAEGPSFGVAPAGTCTCSAVVEKKVLPAGVGVGGVQR